MPAEIAAEVAARGEAVVVMPLRGVADADFAGFAQEPIGMMDPAGAVAALGRLGVGRIVMAGTVHRPGLGLVLAAWQAALNRDEIRRIVRGGDDNVLRGVIAFLEHSGFPVVGVRDVAPGLMAAIGLLAGRDPGESAMADIARGVEALRAFGPLDVGQAVVVADGRVLAVEAAEGTDAMLRRVSALRRHGLLGRLLRHGRPVLAEHRGGVMVKAPKPGQDMRADLPVIGPRTVRLAVRAGLAGIAVEAGGVLVVERQQTLAEAEKLGLFILGVAR